MFNIHLLRLCLKLLPCWVIETLTLVQVVTGESSVLDSFTVSPSKYCGNYVSETVRRGYMCNDEHECALMCLMYDDCTHVNWYSYGNCHLLDQCTLPQSSSYYTTYTRANDSNWVNVPAINRMPGSLAFPNHTSTATKCGSMTNMDEDVCALHCLLTACTVVTWDSTRSCSFMQTGGGSYLVPKDGFNTHVKAVIAGCVSQHSCYAVLTLNTGQTKAMSEKHCEKGGGHLVEFDSQEELDAVKNDGRFGVIMVPYWTGVYRKEEAWQGEKADVVLTVLPWMTGEPKFNDTDTHVTVNPFSSWGFVTPSPTDTAFPFCEFSAITMTTTGKPMTELNDNNLTTCFTPESPSQAAGTTLKTLHLNPIGPPTILVKVHGAGFLCGQDVQVRQLMASGSTKGSSVLHLSACKLKASYTWESKQLCLFSCGCTDHTRLCDAAYLRMSYTKDISICEFQVL